MSGAIVRSEHQRLVALVESQLFKSESVVDLRQICSARGPVRIEECLAAEDKAVVVELDGLLHIEHRVNRSVHAVQADRVVEIRGGIERIERPGEGKLVSVERIA